jgi:hypothetical protein
MSVTRQFVVFDLRQPGGRRARLFARLGDDREDRLAVELHLAGRRSTGSSWRAGRLMSFSPGTSLRSARRRRPARRARVEIDRSRCACAHRRQAEAGVQRAAGSGMSSM